MFDRLIFFVFNTFYRDGKSTDKPVWMRMYLGLFVGSAIFTTNVVVLILKLLREDTSTINDKFLIWFLVCFYGVVFYFKIIKNNYYMDVYKRFSLKYEGINTRPYYILTWGFYVLATCGFLIFIVKVMK